MNDAAEEKMTPENTTPEAESPVVASSVGGILAAAREQAGLSVEEAASSLRLSVRQVQALEADDAAQLPAPTFVRGFIRNYAKLLNLDAEALLEIYRVYAPASVPGAISLHSENIPILNRDKKAWQPYVLASAIVALALGGWMAYMEYTAGIKSQPAVPEAAEVVAATPEPIAVPVTLPEVAPVPVASSGVVETPPPPVAPEVPVAATAKLVMNFSASSWISVTDRDGKELFNKSQSAGSQATVEGMSPLTVVVGNAGGVQLSYNDKPVDLALHTKANVARLTLE